MTQHFLTPKDPEAANVVMIGHDRVLGTFFAQVYKDTGADPNLVLWEGSARGQLPYANQVIDLVRDHAHIPDKLWEALDHDRARAAFRTAEEANAVTHWSPTARVEPEHDADSTHA
ncbi:hypothetical protein [Actinokineospora cianjurensis]|uniref:Uncharacterized protein n=1 Tax=Actinokineospora cianjurensis TaxID=585224 RepID=A0A421B242_9PSEU|nr:hypothetical protein [Actinokineospora cianjurensis]RLK58440.1 hypothetical protein CLV68_4544 [Actinokineospora cianjurensis]